MPRGGKREGAGPKPGYKKKKTLEREEAARIEALAQARLKELQEKAGVPTVTEQMQPTPKLSKDTLYELANVYMSLAALHQPWPAAHGKNPNENETKFVQYSVLARDTHNMSARFQSPTFAAIAIQQQMVSKISVEGGMPDEFAPPTDADGKVLELKPGTIVSADESAPRPDAKPIVPAKSAAA